MHPPLAGLLRSIQVTSTTPITRADRHELSFLQGARVTGVTYHYLPPADEENYCGGGEGVDADLSAIELDLGEQGAATITWAMSDELEGLTVMRHAGYQGNSSQVLEATNRVAWREHIGHEIYSVAASWQVSGEHCPESLWAVRLGFPNGSVVVALGTSNTGIEYMPDELVVVFDTRIAHSYHPQHVIDSSWGKELEST